MLTRRRSLLSFLVLALAYSTHAAIQFDVFLGHDGIVPEASWFPVVCEIKNDGPPFVGVIEIAAENFGEAQKRSAIVELPTGTLKRVVIPVFSTTRYNNSWSATLRNEKGKVMAQQASLLPRKKTVAETRVLGALSRTPSGAPALRPILSEQEQFQPATARIPSALFPDNPIVLESLDAVYLNSERALELKDEQVRALLQWLYAGGHLIVNVEQLADVNGLPWLQKLLPCQLSEMKTVQPHPEIQNWLRDPQMNPNPFADATDDYTFENAPLQVATGKMRDAVPLIAAGDTPLIVTAHRARGRITVLLFSSEREPFRSWKNSGSFWAKLMGVPPELYQKSESNYQSALSADGIFGAMLDSRQVRKLPLGWLFLLLIAYLLVIGPVDQFWLKRVGKPMLTWITFPCYVLIFSGLIYFIGYKLRAGESEWNQLDVVDVLTHGGEAHWRGRTYASIYSPANATYRVASQQPFAALRGEFVGLYGAQESDRTDVVQTGDNYQAELFVPVWTSQLYVSEWWQNNAAPLVLTVSSQTGSYSVTVENRANKKVQNARLAMDERIFDLGEIPALSTKTVTLEKMGGVRIDEFVRSHGMEFSSTVQQRRHAFGGAGSGHVENLPGAAMTVSFISKLDAPQPQFIAPRGLDISSSAEGQQAVLLAWTEDYSPINPLNQFTPRRKHQYTLWRVFSPLKVASK